MSQKIVPTLRAAVEELSIQSSRYRHSCIGQASTYSLRPFKSQSDKWLLIYGREQANKVVASETALLSFPDFDTESSTALSNI